MGMLETWILLKKTIPAFTAVDGSLVYIQVTASQTSYYMVNEDTELEHVKSLVSACVPGITPPLLVFVDTANSPSEKCKTLHPKSYCGEACVL